MNWKAIEQDGQWCVFKIDDEGESVGDALGCHDEKEDADDQVAALYASEGDADKAAKAAKTKRENGMDFTRSAYLHAPDPEDIETWKLRIEEEPGKVTVAQLGRAAAALGPKGYRGKRVQISTDEKKKAAKKLIGKYRGQDVADEDIPDYLWGIAGMAAPKKQGKSMKGQGAKSLDARRSEVERAWQAKQNPDGDWEKTTWCAEVFDARLGDESDYIVAEVEGTYYRIGYAESNSGEADGEIAFADKADWTEVEPKREWVEKAKELKARAAKTAPLVAVKAHPSGEWGRFCGWAAPFGGPFAGKDLDGEFFDRDTDFCLQWYDKRPVLYHHGMDTAAKAEVVAEESLSRIGEMGAWLEGQLKKQSQYAEAIWEMIQKGKMFFSTGSLPQLVERLRNGKLKRWPIVEWTLTPTPANLLAEVTVGDAQKHYKAAGLEFRLPENGKGQGAGGLGVDEKELQALVDARVAEAVKAHKPEGVDVKSIAAQIRAEMKAEEDAAAAAAAKQKEHDDAVAKAAVEAYQKELAAKGTKGLPFEFAVPQGDTPTVPEHISRVTVFSRYDRLGTLDLAMRYMIKSQAAALRRTASPSEQMFRALAVRANKFMQEVDKIPFIDEYGRVKAVEEPAFDPRVLVPWGEHEDEDTYFIEGIGEVPVSDNISPDGVKALLKLAALKSNEVVYSTQNNYGDQWVPTLASAALWRKIRLEAQVLPLFDQFDMPSNPYDYPTESTDPIFYGVNEATDEANLVIGVSMPVASSKVGTGKVTFSAGKIGALTFWSEEMNEDSIIAAQPQFRDQYGTKFAHAIDDVLLNGDETTGTTNISYEGSAIAASNKYLKMDGIRHQALVTTSTDARAGGVIDVGDIRATRVLMGTNGVHGANPRQLALLCDVPTAMQFANLDEVLTVDKFGAQATILNGQLGAIQGIPIVQSEDYSLTDATGRIDETAGDNVYGSLSIVNRMGVKVGWKRRPRIIIGQVPFADTWYILGLARLDIQFWLMSRTSARVW